MAATGEFAARTCTAPAARSDRMRDIVLAEIHRHGPLRVLDLGCGTGSLVRRLAEALPGATVIGLDMSGANVEAAKRQTAAFGDQRVRFVTIDYLQYRDEPFDLIVSDGVLHLIPGSDTTLARKLAADLNANGLLVCGMPYDSLYNRAFGVVRRLLRAVRSPVTDRAILAAARLVHSRDMDDEGLRERVAYMYVPPERVMGPAFTAALTASGLTQTSTHDVPITSPSQLRHNVTVWTKGASV